MLRSFCAILASLCFASLASGAGQKVVYVRASAAAGGSGLSWATAFQSLQQALAAASSLEKPVQIWVASGIYTPFDGSTNRSSSFKLENGIEIYGGFAGTETLLSQRMPGEYSTVLSGDRLGNDTLGSFGNYAENAYHVVSAIGVDDTAILDGVYVRSGNATGTGNNATGAGILITSGGAPTLRDVRVQYNFALTDGAGINVIGSTLSLSSSTVSYNRCNANGAGIAVSSGATATLDGCGVYNNTAGFDGPGAGGGVYLSTGSVVDALNTYFESNTASSGGGAIGESGGSGLFIRGCTFSANAINTQAPSPTYFGGAIWAAGPNTPVQVSLSSFSANTVISGYGGAIATGALPLDVVACSISANRASAAGGGIFINSGGAAHISDSTIVGNSGLSFAAASGTGNAVAALGAVTIANCTITGNSNSSTGGYTVHVASGSLTISNSILYGDSGVAEIFTGAGVTKTVQYSCVQGTLQPGTGNINTNPLFRNAIGPDGAWGTFDDDLRLTLATSPCVDSGSNALVPLDVLDIDGDGSAGETLPLDAKGGVRIVRDRATSTTPIVNMGAIEGGLDQYIWVNGLGGNWNSTGNWSSDIVPTQGAIAVFNNSSVPATSAYTVQMNPGTRAPEAYQLLFNAPKTVTFNFGNDYNLSLVGGKPGDESLKLNGQFGNVTGRLILQSSSTFSRRGIVAPSAAVGTLSGTTARLSVMGQFAGLDLTDRLVVGSSGNGIFDLSNAATVNAGSFIAGESQASFGSASVDGGSTLNLLGGSTSRVRLGDAATGLLSFSSSKFTASAALQSVELGTQATAFGQLILDASTWRSTQGSMYVGAAGAATLQLLNGSKLTTTTTLQPVLAALPGSTANVLIDATSSWTETLNGIGIGGSNGIDGGTATVDVRAGGVLKANGPIVLYRGAIARGLGRFIAPVNNWGSFSPGILDGNPFGILNVTGTYTQSSFSLMNIGSDASPFGPRSNAAKSGVYVCDVQNTTPGISHDQIDVTGTASLGGGIVVVDRDYTPPPQNGPTGVRVVTATFLDKQFDAALMPPITGKRFLTLSYGLTIAGPNTPSALTGASVELVTDTLDSEIKFIPGAERSAAGFASAVATGDVNGDGRPDLVACYPNANPALPGIVVVYINNGVSGTTWLGYTARPSISVGLNPRGVALAKLRAGFNRDIIVTNAGDGTIDVLANNNLAAPSFTRNTIATQPLGSEPWGVAVYGRNPVTGLDTDFAVSNRGASTISTFNNSGVISTIIKLSDLPSGPNPVDVEPYDPDSGKDDDQKSLAVSSGGGTDVTVFVNNGTGSLGAGTSYTMGGTPAKLTHGDFDGDLADDLAVVSPGSSLLTILLGDSLGGFKPAIDFELGTPPTDVKALDADNDGDIDLVVITSDGVSSTTQIYRNDLTYSISGTPIQFALCPEDVLTAASTAGLIGIADVDGTGAPDVLTLDASASKPRLASAINRSTPCRADFNADGFLDFSDFDDFVAAFEGGSPNADFNGDGFLDFSDFDDFVAAFEAGC
ncbi:MAG: FG-GAP-like repeat-containing protein [Planctomycetota bacterium]|nr:FG-GAP-like repeat-containing protein [Planctomycetota bacterium]